MSRGLLSSLIPFRNFRKQIIYQSNFTCRLPVVARLDLKMAEEYFVYFELEDDITVDESDLGLDEL